MLDLHNLRPRPARVLALVLAALCVSFVTGTLAHSHNGGRSDAACQVCHVGHLSSPKPALGGELAAPLIAVGQVRTFVPLTYAELFLYPSSPRAPPSFSL